MVLVIVEKAVVASCCVKIKIPRSSLRHSKYKRQYRKLRPLCEIGQFLAKSRSWV